jgi:hypothetical protein
MRGVARPCPAPAIRISFLLSSIRFRSSGYIARRCSSDSLSLGHGH